MPHFMKPEIPTRDGVTQVVRANEGETMMVCSKCKGPDFLVSVNEDAYIVGFSRIRLTCIACHSDTLFNLKRKPTNGG